MQSDESLRDELLAEVAALAPILTERAPQSEKLGRLDEPTITADRGHPAPCRQKRVGYAFLQTVPVK